MAISELLTNIETDRQLSDEAFLALRKATFNDGHIDVMEADALFRINDIIREEAPQGWSDFFVSCITDFLLRQTLPVNYVSEANAAWLTTRISHDGIVDDHTEMALLMNVLKLSERVPERLEMFAIKQVQAAVVDGLGYLAHNPGAQKNVIDETEVELLRLALYACGGQGGYGISRNEAEMLFDINDATVGADNHESFKDLFVGAVANYLMVTAAAEMPDYDEALRRQKWLAEPGGISWNLSASFKAFRQQIETAKDRKNIEAERRAQTLRDEAITAGEAKWLIDRLNRDAIMHENEVALLKFLADESPDIHESLTKLISRAA